MLHEILLALLGHPGNVIVVRHSTNQPRESNHNEEDFVIGLEVAEDIDFISGPERQIINNLLKLGFFFRRLERFIQLHQSFTGNVPTLHGPESGPAPGLYVRALCTGIDEVLDGYRTEILKAEQQILLHPKFNYPLAHLRHVLREYEIVLPALNRLIDEVLGKETGEQDLGIRRFGVGLHGGQILQRIFRRSSVGVPLVAKCMQRLLFHCHRVLFNFISAWVVYGILTDPFDEFFVEQLSIEAAPKGSATSVSQVADEKSVTTDEPREPTDATAGGIRAVKENRRYRLRVSMLPTAYFSVPLARKVLFIGESVHMLKQAGGRAELLPHSDALKFAKLVRELRERPVFEPISVLMALDSMRTRVTKHLWRLVVVKARLFDHLQMLKDYFLVSKGDFYQALIEAVSVRHLFHMAPTPNAEREINQGPFLIAAQFCGVEDERFFNNLALRLDKSAFAFMKFSHAVVSSYGSSSPNSVVITGAARRSESDICLTGQGVAQLGAAWYGSRKLVDRGFKTVVRFKLVGEESKDDGEQSRIQLQGYAPLKTTLDDSGLRALPWRWGQGFSFVVQNHNLSALPCTAPVEEDASLHGRPRGFSASSPSMAHTRRVSKAGGLVLHSAVEQGLGVDSQHGGVVRYQGVQNSVEVSLHIDPEQPSQNSVSVYTRAGSDHASSDSRSLLLGSAQAEKSPTRGRESESKGVQKGLRALADGSEHKLLIEYIPPMHKRGQLVITVDGGDSVLSVFLDLAKAVRLDSGRAWVGLTGCTGFARFLPGLPLSQQLSRSRCASTLARHITAWSFQEAESVIVNSWRKVRLEYAVDFPVNQVLRNDEFDRYNALFRFLFLVKRVQVELQKTFSWVMHHRKLPLQEQRQAHVAFLLRTRMQFLIDNLQYYLQVDVVEVQFRELVASIAGSKDFEAVRAAHEMYLMQLTRQCFLHNRVISRALSRTFDVCFDFCALVGKDPVDYGLLQKLQASFDQHSEFLFSLLAKKSSRYTSPHIAQLVLRLDFNKYFSQMVQDRAFHS